MSEDEVNDMRKIYIELLTESKGVSKEAAESIDRTKVQRELGYNHLAVRNIFHIGYRKGYNPPEEELEEEEVERMMADLVRGK
ncbi:MAG: hypothetical protein JSW28_08915 [Thermoplasmata archaeon]|nr:MAG: hypothetical protein JSW28_08915 [Thermoplasmata archaeon]